MDRLKLLWLIAALALMFATAGILFLWLDRSDEVFIVNRFTEEEKPESLEYLLDMYLADDEIAQADQNIQDQVVKVLFLGDLMLDRNVGKLIINKGVDHLLTSLNEESFFNNWDIVSVNLEGAVTDEGAHYPPVNIYDFAFKPELIADLKEHGFNYFTLANNHFSDQGQRGIDESRKNLTELQVYFSGSSDAIVNEYSRQDIEINNQTLSFIALSMVYNHFDQTKARDLVTQASNETDFVVVNIHWGNEYEHDFNTYQQEVGKSLVDAGADILIGHHPHVVQGVEVYKNKPIFYSLGNFIFDQYFSEATQEGLGVGLEIFTDRIKISLFPFKSQQSVPRLLKNEEAYSFIDKFVSWSELSGAWPDRARDGYWFMSR